jgi:uncharacterized protein (DUF983 family)
MKQTNLVIVIIGAIFFGLSFIFMMPWALYNKPLFWLFLILGIAIVAIGLHLENKGKKIVK